jgi:hypothetical protein
MAHSNKAKAKIAISIGDAKSTAQSPQSATADPMHLAHIESFTGLDEL